MVSAETILDGLGTWANRFVPLITVALALVIIPHAVKRMRPEKPPPPVVFWPEQPVDSITLPADTLFEFGKSDLTADGRARIGKIAADLGARASSDILVVGHADRIGSAGENQRLSTARALEVRNELAKTIDSAHVAYVGAGSRSPLTKQGECPGKTLTRETLACNARDRRVEIWLRPRPVPSAREAPPPGTP
jgi:OOP family OmpA-OmpF porin